MTNHLIHVKGKQLKRKARATAAQPGARSKHNILIKSVKTKVFYDFTKHECNS